jgi:mTERF domain-containing protein, mitochondrial
MIHLRKRVLSLLLHTPSSGPAPCISPLFSLRRLSTATTPIAASPFSAEDYLVANCGLSRAQATKASKILSHLKSPSKPNAVLAFLAGLGLSTTEVATVVAGDPRFLCADVGKNLGPRLVELSELGLSRAEIARLILISQSSFRRSVHRRNLEFWISVFGSLEDLLRVLKVNNSLLNIDLEKVAKPNLAFLQRCGISATDFRYRFMLRMLTRSPKHLEEALERVDEFGVSRTSWVFPNALALFAILSREKLTMNIQMFEKLGWSRDDIALALSRSPQILGLTEERVRRNFEFLVGEVGLEIPYIARRPVLMMCSLERRLLPRHCLLDILKARGLLNAKYAFYSIAVIGNEKFLQRFVYPYEKSVRGLTAAYVSSCNGKPQWELLCETAEGK